MDGLRKKQPQHTLQTEQSPPPMHTDAEPTTSAPSFELDRKQQHEQSHLEQELQSENRAQTMQTKKSSGIVKKVLLTLLAIFFLSIIAYGSFVLYKTNIVSQAMRIDLTDDAQLTTHSSSSSLFATLLPALTNDHTTLRGADDGRINIVLLGKAGEGYPGENLTDTIMVASINTEKNTIGLLSLPRDLYVPVAQKNYFTKINALYQRGLDAGVGTKLIVDTVAEILDQEIHYYVVADFDGFTEFVDTLDGINVDVERDILDRRYPGPNYSYETFQLTRGLQELNGATALKYARMRHDDPQGDFGRAKRQQKTLQAIKNKVFSLQTLLNPRKVNTLLDTLGDHVRTNITPAEMESFIALAKRLDTHNVTTVVADAWQRDSVLRVSHVYVRGVRAFILVPRVGDFSEVQELAANIFDLRKTQERREHIVAEEARVLIVNGSGSTALGARVRELLVDLGFTQKNLRVSTEASATTGSDQKRPHTSVIDTTGGTKIFSLDDIVKKLPAQIVNDAGAILDGSEDSYDFVLFLGTDIIARHTYDQISIEELNAHDAFTDTDLFTR